MKSLMCAVVLTCFYFFSSVVFSKTHVLTTIYPLTLLAKALVVAEDSVETLLPKHATPHHYQLKISERKKIEMADLIVWIGPTMESALAKPLKNNRRAIAALGLPGLAFPRIHIAHSHVEHSHRTHSHQDPHIWLNPLNLKVIATAITEDLIARNPSKKEAYQKKLLSVLNELDALDIELSRKLLNIQNRRFIVLHPAYSHFTEQYGLHKPEALVKTPESMMSAQHRYKLERIENIDCVFSEIGSSQQYAEKIAKQLGVKSVPLDPLGITLNSSSSGVTLILENIAKQFIHCLDD